MTLLVSARDLPIMLTKCFRRPAVGSRGSTYTKSAKYLTRLDWNMIETLASRSFRDILQNPRVGFSENSAHVAMYSKGQHNSRPFIENDRDFLYEPRLLIKASPSAMLYIKQATRCDHVLIRSAASVCTPTTSPPRAINVQR